jgi:hypothetical protein
VCWRHRLAPSPGGRRPGAGRSSSAPVRRPTVPPCRPRRAHRLPPRMRSGPLLRPPPPGRARPDFGGKRASALGGNGIRAAAPVSAPTARGRAGARTHAPRRGPRAPTRDGRWVR